MLGNSRRLRDASHEHSKDARNLGQWTKQWSCIVTRTIRIALEVKTLIECQVSWLCKIDRDLKQQRHRRGQESKKPFLF